MLFKVSNRGHGCKSELHSFNNIFSHISLYSHLSQRDEQTVGTSVGVCSLPPRMVRDNRWSSLPIPSQVMALLGALHSHDNIFWSAQHLQPAHELINPTRLTTNCQALHQRRSAAAAKGQCFSNSRGTGA